MKDYGTKYTALQIEVTLGTDFTLFNKWNEDGHTLNVLVPQTVYLVLWVV